jgi:hypothetical protein
MRLGIVVREIKPEGCDDCQFFAPFLIADEPLKPFFHIAISLAFTAPLADSCARCWPEG